MNGFANVQVAIFSIFASDAWKAKNIVTIPANTPFPNEDHFIILNLMISFNSSTRYNEGSLIVDIMSKAGKGPASNINIADVLAGFLERSIINNVQFFEASYAERGPSTKTLYASTFQIPFNHYGD